MITTHSSQASQGLPKAKAPAKSNQLVSLSDDESNHSSSDDELPPLDEFLRKINGAVPQEMVNGNTSQKSTPNKKAIEKAATPTPNKKASEKAAMPGSATRNTPHETAKRLRSRSESPTKKMPHEAAKTPRHREKPVIKKEEPDLLADPWSYKGSDHDAETETDSDDGSRQSRKAPKKKAPRRAQVTAKDSSSSDDQQERDERENSDGQQGRDESETSDDEKERDEKAQARISLPSDDATGSDSEKDSGRSESGTSEEESDEESEDEDTIPEVAQTNGRSSLKATPTSAQARRKSTEPVLETSPDSPSDGDDSQESEANEWPTRQDTAASVSRSALSAVPKSRTAPIPDVSSSSDEVSQADDDDDDNDEVSRASEQEDEDSDVEMADQASTAVERVAAPETPDAIPPGFQLRVANSSLDASDVGKLFTQAKLEGKQLWYFTVPASVPLTVVEKMEIPMDEAQQGLSILSHDGDDYGVKFDDPLTSKTIKLMIPNKAGDKYSMLGRGVDRTMHLTRVMHYSQDGDVAANHVQATIPAAKAPRRQPEGLNHRFQPIGVNGPPSKNTAHVAPPQRHDLAEQVDSESPKRKSKKRKLVSDGDETPTAAEPSTKKAKKRKTLDAASTPAPPEASKLTPIEPPKFANRKETPVQPPLTGATSVPTSVRSTTGKKSKRGSSTEDSTSKRPVQQTTVPVPGGSGRDPSVSAPSSRLQKVTHVSPPVSVRDESPLVAFKQEKSLPPSSKKEKSQAAGFTGEKSLPSSSKKEKKQAAASKKEKMQAAESMREKSQPVASEREQSPPTESKKEKKAKAKAKAKAMAMAAPSQASDVTVKKVTPIPVPQIGKTQNHRRYD